MSRLDNEIVDFRTVCAWTSYKSWNGAAVVKSSYVKDIMVNSLGRNKRLN